MPPFPRCPPTPNLSSLPASPSGDYASVSSVSSYAQSVISFRFLGVLLRPICRPASPSGDYASVSSVSSHAQSVVSFRFLGVLLRPICCLFQLHHLATTLPFPRCPPTPNLSSLPASPSLLGRPRGHPSHLRYSIQNNPATYPSRMRSQIR